MPDIRFVGIICNNLLFRIVTLTELPDASKRKPVSGLLVPIYDTSYAPPQIPFCFKKIPFRIGDCNSVVDQRSHSTGPIDLWLGELRPPMDSRCGLRYGIGRATGDFRIHPGVQIEVSTVHGAAPAKPALLKASQGGDNTDKSSAKGGNIDHFQR